MGVINFEELKEIITKYGEQLDEDEIDLFEHSVNVSDGKIIVDGKKNFKQNINVNTLLS